MIALATMELLRGIEPKRIALCITGDPITYGTKDVHMPHPDYHVTRCTPVPMDTPVHGSGYVCKP